MGKGETSKDICASAQWTVYFDRLWSMAVRQTLVLIDRLTDTVFFLTLRTTAHIIHDASGTVGQGS